MNRTAFLNKGKESKLTTNDVWTLYKSNWQVENVIIRHRCCFVKFKTQRDCAHVVQIKYFTIKNIRIKVSYDMSHYDTNTLQRSNMQNSTIQPQAGYQVGPMNQQNISRPAGFPFGPQVNTRPLIPLPMLPLMRPRIQVIAPMKIIPVKQPIIRQPIMNQPIMNQHHPQQLVSLPLLVNQGNVPVMQPVRFAPAMQQSFPPFRPHAPNFQAIP